MKYQGGKKMLGKHISGVMKKIVDSADVDGYLEPFCGGLGVLVRMTDTFNCTASDYHPDLIAMWKGVQDGTLIPPNKLTEKDYLKIKKYESPSAIKGFVGFGCSFGGKFFSGYAQKYAGKKKEDFLKEATNSINSKRPLIKDVDFHTCSYDEWDPKNMLIYCDPPYAKTKFPIKYRRDTKKYDEFDNDNFWRVMRKWSKNNKVFISETHAPEDFISIWEKQSHRSMSQSSKTRYKSESEMYKTEKLFIHENNLGDLII